ncbi:MAG: TIGR01777 family oxidoreductase [Anaerolineaceae bacterium]|nr:TIGR01777 family oxidoreductase [Anaerolineaceae bacterium]
MKIIIAGGTGLIGKALVNQLLADKHSVVVISRNPKNAKHLLPATEIIPWEKNIMRGHFEISQAVINLAGANIAGRIPFQMRWTDQRKAAILESRVNAGNLISEVFQITENKPEVLIQSSAIGFYGPLGDDFVTEAFPNGNDFLSGIALKWEQATNSVEAMGVRRIVLRTGLVFSPDGGIFPLLKLPFQVFAGGKIGTGRQFLSWIHIQDVVNAILFLINSRQLSGIINLTAPNPIDQQTFAKLLGKTMRRPSFFWIPGFFPKLFLGEASTLVLDGQRVLPERLLQEGNIFQYEKLTEALAALLEKRH